MRNINKAKARTNKAHSFVMFQHRMLKHPAFMALSAHANKALLYLAGQYKGDNNGDLSAVWKMAKHCGWTSNGSLQRGISEAEHAGFVIKTRQGGRNRCSLYALAWFPIDACDGKLDISSTRNAPDTWLKINLSEPPTVQCVPPVVQSAKERRANPSH